LELSISVSQATESLVGFFLQSIILLAFISWKGGALNRGQDFAVTRARVPSHQVSNGRPCGCGCGNWEEERQGGRVQQLETDRERCRQRERETGG